MFVNVFEKLTTSHAYSLYEDDLRELLPKLSSTVDQIIALGESILDIENDYFHGFKGWNWCDASRHWSKTENSCYDSTIWCLQGMHAYIHIDANY